ncbi:ABC transporter ATP-binding protein [Halorarum halophilum]|uniref:ABC-type D-xylose/L-arabinose transporter n=1 Tax=Halorarum halophilum TaxID=2743090 RepID=A0A7D5KL92_9EURY|nr:ABC transporter ATP-binding protein [Halobaculum halophilum]QLG27335.1 ABC transporter ATP-binding protein [Halobaculum halophilum]
MTDTTSQTEPSTADEESAPDTAGPDINVRIVGLTKIFQDSDGTDVVAVDDVSIDVRRGEFLVLVGPSGCGKTTTLRTVAGLEEPTEGSIVIEEMNVTGLDPRQRDIAMVFQNYALYPHMRVRENLAFPLDVRKFPQEEIDRRVEEAATLLSISDLLDRKPGALSGGQQQRVALGRAIVREPSVFLMDEPLSNLDAKLRVQMRTELNDLHKRVGKTTIYVTHDQAEAMTLGDRVAVMNDGKLQQVDPPQHLYDNPTNQFVAGFIGEPPMNFFDVDVREAGDRQFAESSLFDFGLPDDLSAAVESWDGDRDALTLGLRPEDIHDAEVADERVGESNTFEAYVRLIEPMGSDKFLTLTDPDAPDDLDTEFSARVSPESTIEEDEVVTLVANLDKIHLFDDVTGENVTN